jgi:hypothetical protein
MAMESIPQAGADTLPGQPPFGPQSAQQPTPNLGMMAAAMAQVSWAVKLLETALPLLGASSDQGKAVVRALQVLTKHVPTNESPGIEGTAQQGTQLQDAQDRSMMQLLRSQMQPMQGAVEPAGSTATMPPPGMGM